MKLKILKSLLYGVVAACLVWSCYDDKGNYDYIRLQEVTIDTSGRGIAGEYALYRYDSLEIDPVVYFDGERVTQTDTMNEELEFYWTIYNAMTGSGVNYTVDTLGREVKFHGPITQPAGKWTLQLTVKQKRTSIETYCAISLQVDESVSDGWLVLYEREGQSDVGLIVNDRVKRNVMKERLFIDLYSASNGGNRLAGPPVAIFHSVAPMGSGEVLIASAEDLVGVDKNSFEATYSFDRLFWNAPAKRKPSWIGGNMQRREVTINDNRIYYANYMSAGTFRTNAFGEPCQGEYGELASWIAAYYGGSYEAVVYDQTNGCFRCVEAYGVNVLPFVQQDDPERDVNAIGMKMLQSDWGRGNFEYSIFQKDNEYALTVCNFFTTTRNTSQVMLQRYDMTGCPGISGLSSMAAAVNGEFIYYGSGDGVYAFNYNRTGEKTQKVWSTPSVDEEVTCVRIQKFYYPIFMQAGILPYPHQVIYIATWNEKLQTGTVYQLWCNPSSGAIDLSSQKPYTGFGKVKDMGWKWSM